MKVHEIMTREVEIANPDDTLQTAAKMMADINAGALPVGENDRLVGMVTDRDITVRAVAAGRDPKEAKVREVMTEVIRYVMEDEAVEEVSGKMAQWQVRRLPVLNKEKRLVGIVALGDLTVGKAHREAAEKALEGVSQTRT
jgi:CBS domain-containing protein